MRINGNTPDKRIQTLKHRTVIISYKNLVYRASINKKAEIIEEIKGKLNGNIWFGFKFNLNEMGFQRRSICENSAIRRRSQCSADCLQWRSQLIFNNSMLNISIRFFAQPDLPGNRVCEQPSRRRGAEAGRRYDGRCHWGVCRVKRIADER